MEEASWAIRSLWSSAGRGQSFWLEEAKQPGEARQWLCPIRGPHSLPHGETGTVSPQVLRTQAQRHPPPPSLTRHMQPPASPPAPRRPAAAHTSLHLHSRHPGPRPCHVAHGHKTAPPLPQPAVPLQLKPSGGSHGSWKNVLEVGAPWSRADLLTARLSLPAGPWVPRPCSGPSAAAPSARNPIFRLMTGYLSSLRFPSSVPASERPL